METNNYDYTEDNGMENIIRINNSDENDELDFDLDYDPNEMYFALLNDDNH